MVCVTYMMVNSKIFTQSLISLFYPILFFFLSNFGWQFFDTLPTTKILTYFLN